VYTKTGEIIRDLQEAKNIMVENIEKLLDRDEKLSIIATKSNNLNERSKNVNYMVAKIKKQEKMKQFKTMMIIVGGIVVRIDL
jgi:vesicle-associated membrane protein 72